MRGNKVLPRSSVKALQRCQRYQTIIILMIKAEPARKNLGEISDVSAETFGISMTIPARAIIIAARRARFFSRNSP